MSLISRWQNQFTKMAKNMPVFQPFSRGLDFNDKGKAEENVYYRREQNRLLEKLRKLLSLQKPPEASDSKKSSKGQNQSKRK